MPEDDPDEITSEEWQSRFGVGYFELKRLRHLYSRQVQSNQQILTTNLDLETLVVPTDSELEHIMFCVSSLSPALSSHCISEHVFEEL